MQKVPIPKMIWILGFISMFMDISSEMIHGFLPVFLVSTLGASYAQVGFIDGLGAGIALVFKVISGPLSDYVQRKKSLVFFGYAMGTLTKPLFAMATSTTTVLWAHSMDRMGKGLRGTPRDALVAEITPPQLRGRAYGLRQALDTLGAFVGPLIAILLVQFLNMDLRHLFLWAFVPGVLAVTLVIFGVQEPRIIAAPSKSWTWPRWRDFDSPFWRACLTGSFLQMIKLGDAFLILRAKDTGLALAWLPVVLISMNFVYSLAAYPAGALSDKKGRKAVVKLGFGTLILANLVLAISSNVQTTLFAIILWGIHLGLTQGNLTAWITDSCPSELRGSALAIFNLVSAAGMFIGGTLAGLLWEHVSAQATFFTASGLAALGFLLL